MILFSICLPLTQYFSQELDWIYSIQIIVLYFQFHLLKKIIEIKLKFSLKIQKTTWKPNNLFLTNGLLI